MIENLEKGQIWGTPDYPGFRYRIDEIMSDSSIWVTITHNYEVIRCEMIDGVEVNHFTEIISVSRWLELMARGVLVKRPAPRIKLNPVGWRIRDWRQDEERAYPSYNNPGISIIADVTISPPPPEDVEDRFFKALWRNPLLPPQDIYGCSPVSPSGSGADPGSSTGSWSAVNPFTSSTNKVTAAEIIEMSKTLRELGQSARKARQDMDDAIAAHFQLPSALFGTDFNVPMITQPPVFDINNIPLPVLYDFD